MYNPERDREERRRGYNFEAGREDYHLSLRWGDLPEDEERIQSISFKIGLWTFGVAVFLLGLAVIFNSGTLGEIAFFLGILGSWLLPIAFFLSWALFKLCVELHESLTSGKTGNEATVHKFTFWSSFLCWPASLVCVLLAGYSGYPIKPLLGLAIIFLPLSFFIWRFVPLCWHLFSRWGIFK